MNNFKEVIRIEMSISQFKVSIYITKITNASKSTTNNIVQTNKISKGKASDD